MEFKDYYKTLGLERDATQDEIKRAYRKLARKYHPDVNQDPGAEDQFKEVGEAYEVLKDPEKRAAYDQLGRGPRPGEQSRPPPRRDTRFALRGGGLTDTGAPGFSDVFASLFGDGLHAGGQRVHRERESRGATNTIALEGSIAGATRQITLQQSVDGAVARVRKQLRTLNVKTPKGT